MDKLLIPKSASSPAEPDSPGTSVKNDSFLEDMGLFSHDTKIYVSNKEAERHVTRRTLSPAVLPFSAVIEEQDESLEQKNHHHTIQVKVPVLQRNSGRREVSSIERRRSGDGDSQTITATGTAKESRAKIQESRSRNQDSKSKPKSGDSGASENQTRAQIEQIKLSQDKKTVSKDRGRRSGSYRESDQSTESSKENKQPSNSHKVANSLVETGKDHQRRSEGKKIESREIPDSVALLSAFKEVVSTYTKEEGMKIHRTLNELHLLSQASLIKNLMFATDEIRKDLQLGENLGQLKALMAENERLRENCSLIKMKNEDLQRRLEESETIKEENARLKLRLQEIAGRKSLAEI